MSNETPATGTWPTRVCSKCSVQSQVQGDFCPHCGNSYSKRGRKLSRKAVVTVIVAGLVIAGVGTGVALKFRNDRAEERAAAAGERRAAEDAAKEEAQEAAELREANLQAKRDRESAERRLRQAAIKDMQKTITTDARENVSDGFLEGPILYTFCNPLGGGSIDDLTALTTTFDCLAVNEELEDGRAKGFGFDATMNWDDGSYTWQLQS